MTHKNHQSASFFGRTNEIKLLTEAFSTTKGSLVACYGRRRIGKSALLLHAYAAERTYYLDGLEGVTAHQQRKHLLSQIQKQFSITESEMPHAKSDWEEIFSFLALTIKRLSSGRTVLILDEFQWIASLRSEVVSIFKSVWDSELSKIPNLVVVLCGSISSFMVKKVLRSKALYGRVQVELNLAPLQIDEISQFYRGALLEHFVLDVAMAVGGVPAYLDLFDPQKSFLQNISQLAFSPTGFLYTDYNRIFISHFGKAKRYEQIVRALIDKPLSIPELTKKFSIKSGGTLQSQIEDLVLAGFIEEILPFRAHAERSKEKRYRILDEYLHFYLTIIEPRKRSIINGTIESVVPQPLLAQWQGFAFERFCRRHQRKIAHALGFSGVSYISGSWITRGDSKSRSGAQVDLLFKRADAVLTVCEIKFCPLSSPTKLISEMQLKKSALQLHYPHFAIQTVLIVTKRFQPPETVQRVVDRVIVIEDLFL
jgi:AAA+ ATPase superfamily predicted ATPase